MQDLNASNYIYQIVSENMFSKISTLDGVSGPFGFEVQPIHLGSPPQKYERSYSMSIHFYIRYYKEVILKTSQSKDSRRTDQLNNTRQSSQINVGNSANLQMRRSEEVVKKEIAWEDLQKYPYRAIGNIAAKYEISPGIWLICRGVAFLIHEKVILSCGHNCFLKQYQGKTLNLEPVEVTFTPWIDQQFDGCWLLKKETKNTTNQEIHLEGIPLLQVCVSQKYKKSQVADSYRYDFCLGLLDTEVNTQETYGSLGYRFREWDIRDPLKKATILGSLDIGLPIRFEGPCRFNFSIGMLQYSGLTSSGISGSPISTQNNMSGSDLDNFIVEGIHLLGTGKEEEKQGLPFTMKLFKMECPQFSRSLMEFRLKPVLAKIGTSHLPKIVNMLIQWWQRNRIDRKYFFKLDLRDCGIKDEDFKEFIFQIHKTFLKQRLFQIDLANSPNQHPSSRNTVGLETCIVLSEVDLPQLHALNFSGNPIDSYCCMYLAALKSPLVRLTLDNCKIDDDGCSDLSGGRWKLIEELSLQGNKISAKGGRYLKKALWPALRVLELKDKQIIEILNQVKDSSLNIRSGEEILSQQRQLHRLSYDQDESAINGN